MKQQLLFSFWLLTPFNFFCLSTETEQSDFGEHGKETVKKYREIFCIFIVLTIFFTLAVARFVFAHIKVVRPKSDRLSTRKKKRLVSSLSTRLQAKVASFLRVRPKFSKKMKKIIQSRKKVASLTAILWTKRRNGYEKAIQDNNNRHAEH